MRADEYDFTASMDTVWGLLNQFTELADTLERTKNVTAAHADMAGTFADALRAAYKGVKEGGDFSCFVAPGGGHA